MPIHITKTPDLYLTPTQFRRYQAEYEKAFSFYAGTPPDFEEWVIAQERRKKSINPNFAEDKTE